MTAPVKWFHSGMPNAPVCSGTAGAIVNLLDKCLVSGFGSVTVSSLTVTGTVATVSFLTAHNFVNNQVVEFSGAVESIFNDQFSITFISATSFSFVVGEGAPSSATGSISCKAASAGWTKEFTGTNVAVFRPAAISGTFRPYLRVSDTGNEAGQNARYARMVGYETMSDVDTGIGKFPTDAQISGGLWIGKSSTLDSNGRSWVMFADKGIFYLFICGTANVTTSRLAYVFGTYPSFKENDEYNGLIIGCEALSTENPINVNDFCLCNFNPVDSSQRHLGMFLTRSYTQLGSSLRASKFGSGMTQSFGGERNTSWASGAYFPNASNGGFFTSIVYINELYSIIRGILPGVLQPLHSQPLGDLDLVTNVLGLPGKTIILVGISALNSGSSYSVGRVAFDLKGPWR